MSNIYKSASSGGGVVTSVTGTNGVTASPTTGAVIVSGVNATTSTVGVASFNPAEFTVTAGAVSLIGGPSEPAVQTLTGDSGGAVVPTTGNINIVSDSNYNTLGGVGILNGAASTLTLNLTRALSSPTAIGNILPNSGSFTSLKSTQGQTFSALLDVYPSLEVTILSNAYSSSNQVIEANITAAVPASISAGFGASIQIQGQDTSGNQVAIGGITSSMDVVTAGSTSSHTDIECYVNGSEKISMSAYPNYAKFEQGQVVNYTGTSANTYVVLATDYYISVDCSGGAKQVNLPNAPPNNQIYIVKDRTGNAAAHNITVTTPGGTVDLDGATSFVININYGSISVIFNGTNYEIF